MANKRQYPRYGGNQPRKTLRKLNFEEISLPIFGEPSNDDNDASDKQQTMELCTRERAEIAEQLTDAMRWFYGLTHRDWLVKYWHTALAPHLLLSLDRAQLKLAIDEFQKALSFECKDNYEEFIYDRYEINDEAGMKYTSTFLFYARNFEVRTKRKIEAIKMLDSYYTQQNNGIDMLETARTHFGNWFFMEPMTAQIEREIRHALAPTGNGIQSINIQVLKNVALVTKTLQKFLGVSETRCFSPTKLVLDMLAESMNENLALSSKLVCCLKESNLESLTLDELKGNQSYLEYMEKYTIPTVNQWILQVSRWRDFSKNTIQLMGALLGSAVVAGIDEFSADILTQIIENDCEVFAETLSLYAITKLAKIADKMGETCEIEIEKCSFLHILPVSRETCDLLAKNLHSRIFPETHHDKMNTSTVIERIVWSEKAAELCGDLFVYDDAAAFKDIFEQMIAEEVSYKLYKELHHAITGSSNSYRIFQYMPIFRMGNLNSLINKAAEDWDESQSRGIAEDVATNLLPRQMGGRNIDAGREIDILSDLGNYCKGAISPLLDIMIDEATSFCHYGSVFVLKYGNWLCTDDPSITPDLPKLLQDRTDLDLNSVNLIVDSQPGYALEWHEGWSTVNCVLTDRETQEISEFRCSITQYHIISKLLASSKPLTMKELLSRQQVDSDSTLMRNLLDLSNGFIKTAKLDDTNEPTYALDLSLKPPKSLVKLLFIEDD